MADAPVLRPRIADIMKASGAIGPDAPAGDTISQMAALAATVVSGTSAATFVVAQNVSEQLSKRFHLDSGSSDERVFAGSYETVGRALILALRALGCPISTAFDTASGAMLEGKKPMTIFAAACALAIDLSDGGETSTTIKVHCEHMGVDWAHLNPKTIAALFAKIQEYLAKFSS